MELMGVNDAREQLDATVADDYTPTTDDARGAYSETRVWLGSNIPITFDVASAEFDRWLTEHDREVSAKTLEDAAQAIVRWDSLFGPDAHEWLVGRACDIREGDDG